jgi:hypothetical protein
MFFAVQNRIRLRGIQMETAYVPEKSLDSHQEPNDNPTGHYHMVPWESLYKEKHA